MSQVKNNMKNKDYSQIVFNFVEGRLVDNVTAWAAIDNVDWKQYFMGLKAHFISKIQQQLDKILKQL